MEKHYLLKRVDLEMLISRLIEKHGLHDCTLQEMLTALRAITSFDPEDLNSQVTFSFLDEIAIAIKCKRRMEKERKNG